MATILPSTGYRVCPPLQRILLNSTARRSGWGRMGFGALCTLFLALVGWVSINVDRADLQARLLHRSPQRDVVVWEPHSHLLTEHTKVLLIKVLPHQLSCAKSGASHRPGFLD